MCRYENNRLFTATETKRKTQIKRLLHCNGDVMTQTSDTHLSWQKELLAEISQLCRIDEHKLWLIGALGDGGQQEGGHGRGLGAGDRLRQRHFPAAAAILARLLLLLLSLRRSINLTASHNDDAAVSDSRQRQVIKYQILVHNRNIACTKFCDKAKSYFARHTDDN